MGKQSKENVERYLERENSVKISEQKSIQETQQAQILSDPGHLSIIWFL
jgi:hypothetical protein